MTKATFATLGLPADLVSILREDGIRSPSSIESASLADAIAGRDVCGRLPASSRSTFAFGLALVMRAQRAKTNRPTALVLVPAPKLALRAQRELHRLAAARGLRIAAVCPGVPLDKQRLALRHGVEILIACPYALEEMLEQRDVRLEDVGIVVVDEADTMAALDMLPAVEQILGDVRADRQTLLYSARLGGALEAFVDRHLSRPLRVDVMTPSEDAAHPWVDEPAASRRELAAVLAGVEPSRGLSGVDEPAGRSSGGRARRHRSGGMRRVR